jgi:hypothetical protein
LCAYSHDQITQTSTQHKLCTLCCNSTYRTLPYAVPCACNMCTRFTCIGCSVTVLAAQTSICT